MAVAASGPNMEIVQFDWFISGRIFPILPSRGGNLIKPCLCRIRIKIFDKISSERVLRTNSNSQKREGNHVE